MLPRLVKHNRLVIAGGCVGAVGRLGGDDKAVIDTGDNLRPTPDDPPYLELMAQFVDPFVVLLHCKLCNLHQMRVAQVPYRSVGSDHRLWGRGHCGGGCGCRCNHQEEEEEEED